MKKSFLLLLFVTLIVSGCGGGSSDNNTPKIVVSLSNYRWDTAFNYLTNKTETSLHMDLTNTGNVKIANIKFTAEAYNSSNNKIGIFKWPWLGNVDLLIGQKMTENVGGIFRASLNSDDPEIDHTLIQKIIFTFSGVGNDTVFNQIITKTF